MVLAVYTEDGQELERLTLPTETPDKTMPPMIDFFRRSNVDALGVGSFGPLDLNPASPTYGSITSTPKLAWANYPLLTGLLDVAVMYLAVDVLHRNAALWKLISNVLVIRNNDYYEAIELEEEVKKRDN